jgi:hypothetical protein
VERSQPWPTSYRRELQGQPWTGDLRWVLACAALGDSSRVTPMSTDQWDALLVTVAAERVTGFLAQAVLGGFPVTDQQHDAALAIHRTAVMTDLRIEQAVMGLARLFEQERVRWRLVKGLAAARLLYDDPALRSTGDVDVLVHPSDFPRAVEAIRSGGGSSWEYLAHGPAAEAAAAAQTFMHASGVELDVHRQVRGHAGRYRLPASLFFDADQTVSVQGADVLVPTMPVVVLHAMLHLSKGGPDAFARLSTLVDLLRARVHHRAAYLAALELAEEVGAFVPALWADRTLDAWFPATADAREVGPLFEYRLRAFDRAVASRFVAGHLHRFVGRHRVRRAWEAALPSAEFQERQQRSGFAQLRHIVVRLLTGREPS